MAEGIWVPPGGSADPRREREEAERATPELSPDELAEQLRRLDVAELLLSLLPTLAQLGYAKLDPGTRDLPQARLAIEGMRALVGVIEGAVPNEAIRDLRQVVGNLQLAYASAAEAAAEPPVRESGPVEGTPGEPGGSPGGSETPRTEESQPADG